MGVDAHIPSSSSQAFVLTICDVLVRFWVNVFLRETKVNDVNDAMPAI